MPISNEMKAHLAQNVTNLCTLYRVKQNLRPNRVVWKQIDDCSVISGNLIRTRPDGGDWQEAGAIGAPWQKITADGYLEFSTNNYGRVALGLSNAPVGNDYATIDYCIHVSSSGFQPYGIFIYESGGLKYSAYRYQAGNALRIEVRDDVVTYWWDDLLLYTSEIAPTYPLYVDAAIAQWIEDTNHPDSAGSTIDNAVISDRLPQVVRYCNHTRNITYNGELYLAAPIRPTQVQAKTGFSPDNTEVTAVLSPEVFKEAELIAGKWDYAEVEMLVINYLDTTMGHARKTRGTLGEVTIRNEYFTAEIYGKGAYLSKESGDNAAEKCRTFPGSNECKLDLTSFTFDAAVTAVTDNGAFTIDEVQADDYFAKGLLRFTSGDNNGLSIEVKSNTGGDIVLAQAMPYAIQIGDTVIVIAGDDRTRATCRDKFNNVTNFRGEPDLPGQSDRLYKFPE